LQIRDLTKANFECRRVFKTNNSWSSRMNSSVLLVVTVAVLGETVKVTRLDSTQEEIETCDFIVLNERRGRVLDLVARAIRNHQWCPDVTVFPGGFFSENTYLGPLDDASRQFAASEFGFATRCRTASEQTNSIVVVGVDGPPQSSPPDRGDQLVVAYDQQGPVAISRKLFPEWSEANPSAGSVSPALLVYSEDFDSPERLLKLKGKGTALLCICYDAFGCKDRLRSDRHASFISRIVHKGIALDRGTRKFQEVLEAGLESWVDLVQQADLVLVSIHGFSRRHSATGEWIQNAFREPSGNYPGLPVLGAAHFSSDIGLPDSSRNTPLAAAAGVDTQPKSFFYVDAKGECGGLCTPRAEALVRLYEVRFTPKSSVFEASSPS
jgi:hypothetical protein